ncbi:MAG: aromatic amino acid lyase, partial [Gemmatimonadales bacterium]
MIDIDGHSLTIEDIERVARADEGVAALADTVKASMSRSQGWLQGVVDRDERTVYGVNTGFGPLATKRIRPGETRRLSRNLVLNCAAGVGDSLPHEIVRAMMLIRANSLAKGLSGVRPEVAGTLVEMLNRGVTPEIGIQHTRAYTPGDVDLGVPGDASTVTCPGRNSTVGMNGVYTPFSSRVSGQLGLNEALEVGRLLGTDQDLPAG